MLETLNVTVTLKLCCSFFSKLLWNYILETLNVMVTSNVCYSFFFNLILELNPRETERDRDLLLLVFEVTFDRILGDLDLFRYRDRDLLLLGDGL